MKMNWSLIILTVLALMGIWLIILARKEANKLNKK